MALIDAFLGGPYRMKVWVAIGATALKYYRAANQRRKLTRDSVATVASLICLLSVCAAVHARVPGFIWASKGGGTNSDYGFGVAKDPMGNAFVTGAFAGTAAFGPTNLP